jgi:hypothetical protein
MDYESNIHKAEDGNLTLGCDAPQVERDHFGDRSADETYFKTESVAQTARTLAALL